MPDNDEDEYEYVCGETYDHDYEVTYEDEDSLNWRCNRCGAEGWEDKTE